jgi:predicted enzyme related to lactoylglutathione lyase
MGLSKLVMAACLLAMATVATAQESGIKVRSVRVLAADPEAIATFYKKAFGMSETRRPANRPDFKEIAINSGATVEAARAAAATPLVITTRPKDAPAGAMASLILQVPNLDLAIEQVKTNGGTLMRPAGVSAEGLHYAFVKDPDGNQIELVMEPR